MTGLACALALTWAGPAQAGKNPDRPPVQRPSTRTDQPAEPQVEAIEQVPTEVEVGPREPSEAASPEQPQPAIEAVPAVAPATLPSYADAIVQPPFASDHGEPVAREVPRDGRGMLVIGSVGLAGAVGLGAGSALLATRGYESGIWGPVVALAAGAGVAGGLLVFGGRRRQLRYGEWEAEHGEVAPRQGNGLVAGGAALLMAGAAGGMFGTIGWAMSTVGFQPEGVTVSPVFPTMVGVGLGSLAAGAAVTIVGMKRHKRFAAWRLEPGHVAVLPVIAPTPGGGQVGLSGRF